MNNEELLKQKRVKLLSELVEEIKFTIEKNHVKGEQPKKIFIYSRLADYTFYSEVSIRKFLAGSLPKDISSFIEGIIQYAKIIGVEEEYIKGFVKEYVSAANAIIINHQNQIKTKNNLVPQDLTTIIRPKKLTGFFDEFLNEEVNISYIYGYSLSGKTKSTMAYITDLINQNIYENIMWEDLKEKNQKEQIYNLILSFTLPNNEKIDKSIEEEICINFLKKSKNLIILDFNQYEIETEVIYLIKRIAKYAKIIIISSIPFKKYEKEFEFYAKTFNTTNFMEKQEFEEMLMKRREGDIILEKSPDLAEKLYQLSGGFPFIAIYILKQIIEENHLGNPLNDSIKKYLNYEGHEYEKLASKIIENIWGRLSDLAKQILITCSKFKYSVSAKLVSYICNVEVTDIKWRDALKELYDNDLITSIILHNPRFSVNNMIKMLVLTYSKQYDNQNFHKKIAEYYIQVSTNVGECYNDLKKLEILDDVDEWNIVVEVLEYLEKAQMHKEYINIVRELKYYIYVRGIWQIGQNSLHLKRANFAKEINDENEELEGLCDYINICSKSKNKLEAEKYLNIAENLINENIDKRVLCLYYHVKALYLNNCIGNYEQAYEIWKNNRKHYLEYVNEYRKLVNRLWEDRCYLKIEKDIDKVCDTLITSCENAKQKQFTRGIIDYQLLIANKKIEKFEINKNYEYLEEAEIWLKEAKQILDSNSNDIRNEAFYYKLKAIVGSHKNDQESKLNFIKKAIELYELINCKEDIKFLEGMKS